MFSNYLELTKPRITFMVLITTSMGYFFGARGIHLWTHFVLTLAGIALASSGSSALNQYLERDADAKMERTKRRALPQGLISPSHALAFGIILTLAGVFLLAWKVNLLTGFLVLLAAFLYVLVYTPMKKLSWLNTSIGAIPGAIPPLAGWTAASGDLGAGGWILFWILFLWQHPHFFAIAWMYRTDYEHAGFKMLPVVEPDGRRMFRQIIWHSLVLIPVSLLPAFIGMSGKLYAYGALALGLGFLAAGVYFSYSKKEQDARKLLRASIIYLPLLFLLILADAV
ncbi:MAG: protoheme IX farnesyltransferase [Candidatus Omnitrophica bacterium]|nr:protoheme IX farnesyltransferase [Candidatus Omnitrophota bacterium]